MTKIVRIILGIATIAMVQTSCKGDSSSIVNIDNEKITDVVTKIYTVENLQTQSFTINSSIDNIITGESGTVIRVNRNTFVDQEGKTIKGKVDIKLIEALSPIDMVLGNLTTTYNGNPLETGGMIYLNAVAENKTVSIARDKSILIKMPTDSTLSGMSVFTGLQDSLGIKWANPLNLPNPNEEDGISFETFEKTTNVLYSVDGFSNEKEKFPEIVNNEVSRIAWEGDGLKISKDSVFKVDKYTVRFYKQNKLQTWSQTFRNTKGQNSFAQDQKINYLFSIKELGWANIDRLLEDPRTREVELTTSIENENDFKFIYVTMVTKKMYLPGYQKKDETFCFSHNDEEKQKLPVGETATILATAYKNDLPYFAIKKITISEKQTITFKLEETTTEKIKAELIEKL